MQDRYISNEKKFLRQCGFRATPKKVAILKILSKASRPLSIVDIHKKIGLSNLDQATLYRNLEAFTSSGITRRVDLQLGRAYYYELAGKHHHHLVCVQCGEVKDIDVCDFKEAIKRALRQAKTFASVRDHVFELTGLCKLCARTT